MTREWPPALASTLDEVARGVDAVARRIADGWPDTHGREWAERLHLLGRSLEREADAAAELARAVDLLHDDAPGPRLGSTDARRADDHRGVRLPGLDGG